MKERFEDIVKKTSNWETNIEELNVKMADFNIYDLFKNNAIEGGSTDAGIILVQNLEKKVFKKFEFSDDKIKRSEDEIHKIKNSIQLAKANMDSLNKANQLLKEDLDKMNQNISETREEGQAIEERAKNLNEINRKSLLEEIEKHSKQLKDQIDQNDILLKAAEQTMTEKDLLASKSSLNNENDTRMQKELTKRIIELEKHFKIFSSSINIEAIKGELAHINDILNSKVNNQDFYEMKESSSKILHLNFLNF